MTFDKTAVVLNRMLKLKGAERGAESGGGGVRGRGTPSFYDRDLFLQYA